MNHAISANMQLSESWFADVARYRPPQLDNSDSKYFCSIVEQASYTKNWLVIEALFETLTDVDCGGVLESVYGVLGTLDVEDYYAVLFKVLPAITSRAPNAAAQALDFPGRDLSYDELKTYSHLAVEMIPYATMKELVKTMTNNGMSESENHEAFFAAFSNVKVEQK